MLMRALLISMVSLYPLMSSADDSLYCPQHSGYINIGMSTDQVVAACGDPLSKQQSNQPATIKVRAAQYIYNNMNNQSGAFRQILNMDVGTLGVNESNTQYFNGNAGGGGTTVQINVTQNKISSITLNDQQVNSFSGCTRGTIAVGDPETKIIPTCDDPSVPINQTWINQVIPSQTKPEIWIYQLDQYHPPITLTFVDGKLQSIN